MADVGVIPGLVVGTIKARLAFVAVYAFGVVLAVATDPTSVINSMNVQTELLLIHFLIIVAVVSVSKAVAGFADIGVVNAGSLPLFLRESRAALLALVSTSVVLAPAAELVRIHWVGDVARVSVSIAHTPTTNFDILDTVEVPPGDCGVLTFD